MSEMAPVKICIRCGRDCSNRPRTKDAHGSYTCRECYDKAVAAHAPKAAQALEARPAPRPAAVVNVKPVRHAVPASSAASASDHEASPADEPALSDALGDGFSLDDDPALAAIAAAQPKECANCGLFLPRDTIICTRCGLNTQTGQVLGTQKVAGEGRQCFKCGYSLQGLKTVKCPECGTDNFVKTKEEKRREREKKEASAVVRNAYLVPVGIFGLGLAASVGILSAFGVETEGAFIALMMRYLFFVPVAVAIFFVCCLIWIGFDAPMHLSALRLAAALAITDPFLLPSMVLGFYGIGLMGCALGLAIYKLMDLEMSDAIILAIILVVTQRAIIIAIAVALRDAQ